MREKIMLAGILLCAVMMSACTADSTAEAFSLENAAPTGRMELRYANQFTAEYYDNGISLVTVGDGEKYLLVPRGETTELPEDITIIRTPAENIYLAASSAMDLFFGIGAEGNIRAAATLEHDWTLPQVKEAMGNEDILYAGKYSAPDYELILSEGCDIAVESTMIYHKPEVKEQLERLGIPVFVERSSYESHPLGRLEWIKLYGLMTGRETEAEKLFAEQSALLERIIQSGNTGKTAAFFYIGSNGYVVVRKPGDYVSKMIELGGGKYIFTPEDMNAEENALSAMNMQFEAFYSGAAGADVLIYNSAIDGGMDTLSQLIEKNSLLADLKAVKSGDVWCAEKKLFQQTTAAADVISELNLIFSGNAEDEMEFFHRLK